MGMICLVLAIENAGELKFYDHASPQKIALAIAFDTSLSMDTGPDPTRFPEMKSRLERGKYVVLEILSRLEEEQRNVMSSVLLFTVRAANALGWNPNLREVGETLEMILNTNLIGRGGTDMGAVLARSVEVFDALPDRDRTSAKKVLLIVSDGESTLERVDIAENLAAIRQRDIKIIALQVGLLDEPEGIREYDEFGFTGFWDGAGQLFSVPDVNTMIDIGGRGGREGFYARAEDPDAVDNILSFMGTEENLLEGSLSVEQSLILILWCLSVMMLKRLLS